MAQEQARFLSGSPMRHITVMSVTASVGLMAVFLVDLVDMIFISMLGQDELAAAIEYLTETKVIHKLGISQEKYVHHKVSSDSELFGV